MTADLFEDFEDIYNEFHLKIRRYLRRLVGPSEAQDLTQEVFARVSQALPHFRADSKISTWVYRIATNAALDRLRSPSLQRATQVSLESQRSLPQESADIEQELVRREMNDCIRQYVEKLPPSYRPVVILSEGRDSPTRRSPTCLESVWVRSRSDSIVLGAGSRENLATAATSTGMNETSWPASRRRESVSLSD